MVVDPRRDLKILLRHVNLRLSSRRRNTIVRVRERVCHDLEALRIALLETWRIVEEIILSSTFSRRRLFNNICVQSDRGFWLANASVGPINCEVKNVRLHFLFAYNARIGFSLHFGASFLLLSLKNGSLKLRKPLPDNQWFGSGLCCLQNRRVLEMKK